MRQSPNGDEPEAANHDQKGAYNELSADQRVVIHTFASELFDVVSRYKISPLSIERDDLSEEDIESNRVWSVVEYYAVGNAGIDDLEDDRYKTDAMLTPGFGEGAIIYHLAENPYSDEQPPALNPYTTLFFVCTACDSNGCDECGGAGELIFGAVWDGDKAEFWRE